MMVHVVQEKIDLINRLLNDSDVSELYNIWINLPRPEYKGDLKVINAKNAAFRAYAVARDKFLGLPLPETLPLIFLSNLKKY